MLSFKNTPQSYGLIAKVLHWSIAVLFISLIGLGYYMVGLDYYHRWYQASLAWHRALGMIILALAVLKLVWLSYSHPPRFATEQNKWLDRAARVTHIILIAFMLLIPVSGYLISTSAGASFSFFSLFNIPAIFHVSETVRDIAIKWHYYLAYFAGVLIVLHVVAALKHQFINKDGTLERML